MSDAEEKTREVLGEVVAASFLNKNRCHLKRKDHPQFGFVTLQDALDYNYRVQFLDAEGEIQYETLDALLQDGWRLD